MDGDIKDNSFKHDEPLKKTEANDVKDSVVNDVEVQKAHGGLLQEPYVKFGKFKADPVAGALAATKAEEVRRVTGYNESNIHDFDIFQRKVDTAKYEELVKLDMDAPVTTANIEDVAPHLNVRSGTPIDQDDDDVSIILPPVKCIILSQTSQEEFAPNLPFGMFKQDVTGPLTAKVEEEEDLAPRVDEELDDHDVEMVVAYHDSLRPTATPQPQIADHNERHLSPPAAPDSQDNVGGTPTPEPEQRQPKRRRVIMDAVVLPTLQDVRRRAEEVKKVENMKNPKATMKKLERCFDVDTIRARLRPIGLDPFPITLERSIREVMVPRGFISSVYGGGLISAWTNVSAQKQRRLNNTKYLEFLYLSLDLNCHAPEVPGSPGLYFDAGIQGRAYPIKGTHRLITRIAKSPIGPLWQYQGQYQLKPVNPLTPREWASVAPSVRTHWAREIHKSTGWGKDTQERIARQKAQEGDHGEVTVEDISQALLRGDESVAVWTMKCVGYDEEFQRDLAAKFANTGWTPKQKAKTAAKNAKAKKESEDGSVSLGASRGQKRKRANSESDESDESDNGAAGAENGEEEEESEPELRKTLGRKWAEEEYAEAKNVVLRDYKKITVNEIVQDLLHSDETVAVWTMKCVGYDEEFQRDLATKYANWTPEKKKAGKTKEPGKKAKVKKERKDENVKPGKRKRTMDSEPEESQESDKGGDGEDSDDEESARLKQTL
ncbi:hypothetical protein DXG01_011752, partial [Tephrocybe rancida]